MTIGIAPDIYNPTIILIMVIKYVVLPLNIIILDDLQYAQNRLLQICLSAAYLADTNFVHAKAKRHLLRFRTKGVDVNAIGM